MLRRRCSPGRSRSRACWGRRFSISGVGAAGAPIPAAGRAGTGRCVMLRPGPEGVGGAKGVGVGLKLGGIWEVVKAPVPPHSVWSVAELRCFLRLLAPSGGTAPSGCAVPKSARHLQPEGLQRQDLHQFGPVGSRWASCPGPRRGGTAASSPSCLIAGSRCRSTCRDVQRRCRG